MVLLEGIAPTQATKDTRFTVSPVYFNGLQQHWSQAQVTLLTSLPYERKPVT